MDQQIDNDIIPPMKFPRADVAAVILAGGRASRFGFEDKALKSLSGKPLIDYVLDKVAPYAANTLISVNRNLSAYEYPKLQLLKDEAGSSNGPLAGIFSAMLWCQKNAPEVRHLACAPADVPYFAEETYRLLITAAIKNKSHISWVAHDGQAQPLFSVWPIELIPQVKRALSSGIYGVKILIQRLPNTVVKLRRSNDLDFRNINTQEELNLLELAASARESL